MAANRKKATARHTEDTPVKSFLDMIAPSVVKFNPDHFICGNTFRCVWALREYPTQTDEQALLRHLGEKDGITLRIYTRQLTPAEEDRILHNAANKNRMNKSNPNDLRQTIIAETNLQDMISMEGSRHRNKEPLFHCAVYIELTAPDYDTLKLLQTDVLTELVRSKLNIDRLLLRQQQGFCCVSPVGYNAFGAQFERVLPASSVANLYPFNYSGKTDAKGFYIGKDKYGSNILVDFDQRDEDKTSANILILGNSGQGKSYLMKLLILNLLESGKSVITLDAEHEQREMCEAVGGCFADLMAGQYIINVLEPKCWDDGGEPEDKAAPEAFRKNTLLAQHISFVPTRISATLISIPSRSCCRSCIRNGASQTGLTSAECGRKAIPPSPTSMTSSSRSIRTIVMESISSTPSRSCVRSCWGCTLCVKVPTHNSSMGTPILPPAVSSCSASKDCWARQKMCATPCCSIFSPSCQISC